MAQQRPILLMAGGTGGHIFPALAIATELKKHAIPVHWLGTPAGMEQRLVPPHHIPLHVIHIRGLRGKTAFSLLLAPFKISWAIIESIQIIRRLRPAVVVGMGGFVSGPGGMASWLLRIPLIIHEQNAIAGLTNRWLARLARQTLEAFPQTFANQYHALHTGNPLRADIVALSELPLKSPPTDRPLNILIFGGSLGAKALNETLPQALQQLQKPIAIRHQVGEKHLSTMQAAYEQAQFPVQITAFIEDMAAAYHWADLVICRAGALTVSELAQAGKPSILIPFPFAVDDHQTQNAQFLAKQQAAILMPQADLTHEKLREQILALQSNPQQLYDMAKAARELAKPLAVQQIVDVILKQAKID